jgi:hypothetical protein
MNVKVMITAALISLVSILLAGCGGCDVEMDTMSGTKLTCTYDLSSDCCAALKAKDETKQGTACANADDMAEAMKKVGAALQSKCP